MFWRRHHEEEERSRRENDELCEEFADELQRQCYDFDSVGVLVRDAFYLAERKMRYNERCSDTKINLQRVIQELQKTIEGKYRKKNIDGKTKCNELWDAAKNEGVRGYLVGMDSSKKTRYSNKLITSIEQFVVIDNEISVISHMNRNDHHCYNSDKKEISYYSERYETVDSFVQTLLRDKYKLQYYVVRINEEGNISDIIRYEAGVMTDLGDRFREDFEKLVKKDL